MTTLTLKINERSKAGKAFLEFAKNFFQDNTSVTVVEEESPYNPEFVAKIRRAEQQKGVEVKNIEEWIASL